jgi:hypothetical protein
MSRWRLVLSVLVLLTATASSQAGWRVGIGIGIPFYGPPYYYRPYPYYYYGAPVVYAVPPPVVVAPAPVPAVVQPAPVVTRSPGETIEPAPALPPPPPASPSQAPATLPAPTPVVRGVRPASYRSDLQELNDPDVNVRADAIMRLGRNRDRQAVGPITRCLREDGSPVVREAAARALGLIALPASLSALQHAAQADEDRDVRRSAAFAADVIRTNMRR